MHVTLMHQGEFRPAIEHYDKARRFMILNVTATMLSSLPRMQVLLYGVLARGRSGFSGFRIRHWSGCMKA